MNSAVQGFAAAIWYLVRYAPNRLRVCLAIPILMFVAETLVTFLD